MAGKNKRSKHLERARQIKKQRRTERLEEPIQLEYPSEVEEDLEFEGGTPSPRAAVHWDISESEGDESEEELEMTDGEDNGELDGNYYTIVLPVASSKLKY
jgi:hypothetical protein